MPKLLTGIVMSCMLAGSTLAPRAQEAEDFYKGKTISIIVGFAAGGGYDTYARLLSRHLGRYIPGNPQIIVQNMVGAGSVRAANYVYASAPKDGTVIAAVNQNMPMYQLLGGASAQFDASKFSWLGSLVHSNSVIATWHTSKTKTLEDALTRVTLVGGSGTNSDSHIFPTLLNHLLGTKFKVINGYAGGSADINLALERGEVEGRGGFSWASLKSTNANWLAEKKLNFLMQFGLEPEPEMGDTPMLQDKVKTEIDKQVAFLISLPIALGYGYWLAPEVPASRLAVLRRAWAATVRDPELIAEAAKMKLDLRPTDYQQSQANVAKAAALPKEVLKRTAEALEWKAN
jgi:hypothetical protein